MDTSSLAVDSGTQWGGRRSSGADEDPNTILSTGICGMLLNPVVGYGGRIEVSPDGKDRTFPVIHWGILWSWVKENRRVSIK